MCYRDPKFITVPWFKENGREKLGFEGEYNFMNSCHLVLCMTNQNLIKIIGFVSTQVHNVYLHLSPCNKTNSKLSFFTTQPLLVPAWYTPLQPCINLNASSLGCHGEISVPSTLMLLEAENIIPVPIMYTINRLWAEFHNNRSLDAIFAFKKYNT